jgi:hypothetical protein
MNDALKKFQEQHPGTKTGYILEDKGDIPLTYSLLQHHLKGYYMSYEMLHFAQIMLTDALEDVILHPEADYPYELKMGNHKEIYEDGNWSSAHIKKVSLRNDIKPLFDDFKASMNGDDRSALQTTLFLNNQYIRKKFINTIYEILEKYVGKHESQFPAKTEKTFLRKKLQNETWYSMLMILRNAASHADGLEVYISFPKYLSKAGTTNIKWETIEATDGMLQHELRYNDEELKVLYSEMCQWIIDNRDAMIQDDKGNEFPNLV